MINQIVGQGNFLEETRYIMNLIDQEVIGQIRSYSGILFDFSDTFKILNLSLQDSLIGDKQQQVIYQKSFMQINEQVQIILNYSLEYLKSQLQLLITYFYQQLKKNSQEIQGQQQKDMNEMSAFLIDVDQNSYSINNDNDRISMIKIKNFDCPLCELDNLNTVEQVGLHITQDHSKYNFDFKYYCPYCIYSNLDLERFVRHHLFKRHIKLNLNGISYYEDPYRRVDFKMCEEEILIDYISKVPFYTRFHLQFMELKQQQQQQKNVEVLQYQMDDGKQRWQRMKQQLYEQYVEVDENQFIRGKTAIKFDDGRFLCPICGMIGFHTLRQLGTHLKTKHGSQYPNNLFCPHCLKIYIKASTLSQHLLRKHSQKENLLNSYYQVVYTEEKVLQMTQLEKIIIIHPAYHTQFNSHAPVYQ